MSTRVSPAETTREDRDVVTIPEARPPRRWIPFAVVACLVIAALALGAMSGAVSRRGAIRDRDARIAAAEEAARQADLASQQAQAQASSATAQVNALTVRLAGKQRALAIQHARGKEAGTVVFDLRRQIVALRGRLALARHAGAQLTGLPLAAGRYPIRLVAVGVTGSPARIVFDIGTWLRGKAARRAAIADGLIGPNGRLPHHRYFRNHELALRVMRVAPGASISLRSVQGHPVWGSTLGQLQDLVMGQSARARSAQHDPYWIVVRSGAVVAIHRQAYP